MNVCGIWPFAQISDDFYYLGIWQCARYFVAALFKELALITITEMWGLESRSRTSRSRSRILWQSLGLGLVSKFEPGLGLGGYGLDYITDDWCLLTFWRTTLAEIFRTTHPRSKKCAQQAYNRPQSGYYAPGFPEKIAMTCLPLFLLW